MPVTPRSGAASSARRALSIAILAASAACSSLLPGISLAEVPAQSVKQVPGYYHMTLGDFQVTALYDGAISLTPALLHGINDDDTKAMLAGMFVPLTKDGVQTAVNGYLVNTGKDLILVDTGAAACFGPTLGGLGDNLKAAGFDATQVTKIFLTHLHGDHACGMTADGKRVFPNATVYVTKDEAGFWLNKETAAKAPKDAQPFFEAAQQAVAPYEEAGKLKQFEPGDILAEGVKSVALTGHTPGHAGYLFSSDGRQLLVWGDIVHSHSVQFARPDVSIDFDTDQKQAIATRKELLARASKEKFWIAGAHLPFPGIGHVAQEKEGYRWIPAEFSPLPKSD
ncbi:MBL fold metallo-hydrolase [Parapusillimonas sp. SGNA-6]|nr:MBL fold metallo-hydrolase [Parapusillimonas sp. SGNA-6]